MRRSTLFSALLFLFVLCAGCRSPVDPGEPCFDSDECKGGSLCVAVADSFSGAGGAGGEGGSGGSGGHEPPDRFCMIECSEDVILCENDGEACVRSRDDDDIYVCLSGGDPDNEFCTTSFDCRRGWVCVLSGIGASICRPLCDPAGSNQCDLDCIPFDDDETRGFCEVPVPTPTN